LADVFKQLLEGRKIRSQKTIDKKTRSFLNKEESDYYGDNKVNIDESDFDISLGADKDVPNYLQDIEKISFRDLDTKSPKDQLKILKTEYQRVYDKANHLNDMYVTSEKTISNFLIEKRQDEKTNKEIRKFIRNMVSVLPGNSDLKEIIERGSWLPEEVEPLLNEALSSIVARLKNLEESIAFETQEIRNENLGLKEKILMFREALKKVEKIEERLNRGQQQLETSSSSNDTNFVSEDPFGEDEDEEVVDVVLPDETEDVVNENNHKPHFGNFYDEFDKSYNDLKKEEAAPYKPAAKVPEKVPFKTPEKTVVKEPVKTPIIEPKKVAPSFEIDSKHPLSPDFVETEKETIMELFDENINDYINNLSTNQEFILGIIGQTGLSRNPDLRDFLTNHEEGSQIYVKGKRFDYQSLSNDVAILRDKGILLDDKLSLGGNGGSSSMIIFELSDVGKQCFKMIFKDNPVIAEKRRIVEHHSSLEHGYLIKDSSKIFREMGMTVHTDLSKVTFKIDSKTRKVFDFLVEDKDGKTMHIEVERGTHTKEDFFYALDKIYQITKEFYFITPNETVKTKKTKQMFFSWVTERLGGIQKADVILNITTIDTLRKKPKNIWETTDLRNLGQ